jgi:hypothetical protein
VTVLRQDLRDAALLALHDRESRGIRLANAGQLWNAMRPHSYRVGNQKDDWFGYELKQMAEEGLIEVKRRKINSQWRSGWMLTEKGREAAQAVSSSLEQEQS